MVSLVLDKIKKHCLLLLQNVLMNMKQKLKTKFVNNAAAHTQQRECVGSEYHFVARGQIVYNQESMRNKRYVTFLKRLQSQLNRQTSLYEGITITE